jgi:hypothetical protein
MPGSNSEACGRFCYGLARNIVVDPIITLLGRITARECVDRFGNQMHSMIQTIFPNNDAVFQDDSALIHTVGAVQSFFQDHEGELQQSPWPT